jgi:hypothetical protein
MRLIIPVVFILVLSISSFGQQRTDTVVTSDQSDKVDLNGDTTIYTTVDSITSYPGGSQVWIKYLEKNLNPFVGLYNGAKPGTYKVIIEFTVTKDGRLKDFIPMTKYKYGFEDEVIRVLKLSPQWIPAKKNGINVNSKVKTTQVFMIEKGL